MSKNDMDTKKLSKEIKQYRALGFRPFPVVCFEYTNSKGEVKREKKPVGEWKAYQTRPPSDAEIERWCAHPYSSYYGIGISTDGMIVLDFDHKDGKPNLLQFAEDIPVEATMWTQTASGGVHMYFISGEDFRNATNIFGKDKNAGDTLIDVRADGGYVVVGSTELWNEDPLHPKDRASLKTVGGYHTNNLCKVEELATLPSVIANAIREPKKAKSQPKYKDIGTKGKITDGSRHETAVSLAYRLLVGVKSREEYVANEKTYWEVIARWFEDWEENKHLHQQRWDTGVQKLKAQRGEDWLNESNRIIRETQGAFLDEIKLEEDLNEWGLEIEEVQRIGDIFKFKLKDGGVFELNVEDFYSQTKFRTAYLFGTSKPLKAIRKKSFEAFLMSLKPVDLVDSGTSLSEILQEILVAQHSKISESETEDEALEHITVAPWASYGSTIYFMPASLLQVHSSLGRKGNISKIVSALADLGAEQDRVGNIKFWKYVVC